MYKHEPFKKAMDYADQNIDVQGMEKLSNRIKSNYKEYRMCMDDFLSTETPIYEELEKIYKEIQKKENIWKILAIVMLIVFLIHPFVNVLKNLTILILLAMLIVIVEAVVYKVKAISSYNNFLEQEKKMSREEKQINNKYLEINEQLYRECDNLYLSSLDSTERQLVLMQREMNRMKEESLRKDELLQKTLKQQQELQRELAEEQRRTRRVQEEILEIERERESRRY